MTDDLLSELLLQWEERYEKGEDVPVHELCQDCPELAAPLAEAIADLKQMDWLNRPGNARVVEPSMSGVNGAASLTAIPNSVLLAGRYRLEAQIAEGGFGQVWKGYDLDLQRSVAIKLPHRRLVSRPEDAAAYLSEARTVAGLDHPNIVPVYDVGSTEECPCFIVSKFIEGTTLAQRTQDDAAYCGRGSRTGRHGCRGAALRSRQGLVHRDIKPGNILLDTSGKPFVADFGLALKEENIGHGHEVCWDACLHESRAGPW